MAKAQQDTPQRPLIGEYEDYRAFLRDRIVYLKATRPSFSYRNFSRVAGFSSPNFLKQVAEGRRNVSHKSIARFAKGLYLDDHEHTVFEALVLLDQAQTDAERNRYYQAIRRLCRGGEVGALGADQYDVYSHWYALVVRELAAMDERAADPEYIARRVFPRIRPRQAREALELLERLGLLVRDEDGRLRVADQPLSTGPIATSLAARNSHRAMLGLAADSLDSVPKEQRNVTSLTVSLDRERYTEACEIISELRRRILILADREGDEDDASREVYQVVFSAFPVTRETKK